MYDAISQIYDQAGWADYSVDVFQKLKPNLQKWKIKKHLDLACGTGVFCAKMHKAGISTRGLDISPQMLKIARKNYPKIKFRRADMRNFRDKNRYDLITCLYDSINHLSNYQDWEKSFKNIYTHLELNGYLLFDLNTISAVKKNKSIIKNNKNNTKISINKKNINRNTCRLTIKWNENNKKNNFFLLEKSYPYEKIKKSLQKIGFNNSDLLFNKSNKPDSLPRLFILAQK